MGSTSIPENYIPILLFIVVGLIFGAFALLGGSLVSAESSLSSQTDSL